MATIERGNKVSDERVLLDKMTPQDVDNAFDIINYLAGQGEFNLDDAGTLIASAEPLRERLLRESRRLKQQREVASMNRRKFLSKARNWAIGLGMVGFAGRGIYSVYDNTIGPAVAQKRFEQDRALEMSNTLSVESSSNSYSGWSVRYARRDEGSFLPTNAVSDPLPVDTWIKLSSNRVLNRLEDTGVVLKDHIRTTDGQPVGKLAIVTRYTPPISSNYPASWDIGEQWVLRDQSTEIVNSNILIFENQSLSAKHFLSVSRSKTPGSQSPAFILKAYQPQSY